MKLYIILAILGTTSFIFSMDAPARPQPRLGQAVPSLKETSATQIAKQINSFNEFEQVMAKSKLPQDIYCSVITAIIKGLDAKSTKFTDQELAQLIDQYCINKIALKSFAIWKMRHGLLGIYEDIIEPMVSAAREANDQLGLEVAQSILERPFANTLSIALRKNRIAAVEFFVSMGLQPKISDLMDAIGAEDLKRVQLLINSGVQVEDPKSTITAQPLFRALLNNGKEANEAVIALLIHAGASLIKPYMNPYTPYEPMPTSIAEYVTRLVHMKLAHQVPTGYTEQQWEAYLNKLLSIINKYVQLKLSKK